jgi:hypothetical protein
MICETFEFGVGADMRNPIIESQTIEVTQIGRSPASRHDASRRFRQNFRRPKKEHEAHCSKEYGLWHLTRNPTTSDFHNLGKYR